MRKSTRHSVCPQGARSLLEETALENVLAQWNCHDEGPLETQKSLEGFLQEVEFQPHPEG